MATTQVEHTFKMSVVARNAKAMADTFTLWLLECKMLDVLHVKVYGEAATALGAWWPVFLAYLTSPFAPYAVRLSGIPELSKKQRRKLRRAVRARRAQNEPSPVAFMRIGKMGGKHKRKLLRKLAKNRRDQARWQAQCRVNGQEYHVPYLLTDMSGDHRRCILTCTGMWRSPMSLRENRKYCARHLAPQLAERCPTCGALLEEASPGQYCNGAFCAAPQFNELVDETPVESVPGSDDVDKCEVCGYQCEPNRRYCGGGDACHNCAAA